MGKGVEGVDFAGTWHIYDMEMWGEEYFNTEVQAHIKIESNNHGHFQFGLVSGAIDGRIVDYPNGKRFEFTWEGNDECDPACGSGWVRMRDKGLLEGEFRIHNGDWSTFRARKVKQQTRPAA